ncbi:hypothetical protein NON08_14775 [Cetobacterium somerae]|uniref:hypothetical protein n=1 Tax=Cetobacterium sp. NK01 TaxID=2993530 RepID=UPI002116E6F5|nr:hypothetical protein [Cetobacterium sp. NK01]MCQ8213763.1 hypothetical protein [Cetobacterium sp. NK01]
MNYQYYIKNFKKYVENKSKLSDKMVFNKDLENVNNFDTISWIIVGDNPGTTEFKNQQYFSEGAAANNLRKFFDKKLNLKKNENYICLNKTPIYSVKTKELSKVDQNLLKNSFSTMAKLIFDLHTLNPKINVLIVGFSSKSIKPFFSELKKQYEENDNLINNLYVVGHFSYGWFFRKIDIKKIKDEQSFITQLKKNHNSVEY